MYFYAVAAGRSPGVYTSWAECHVQVKGFSGNDYKRFNTQSEADDYIDKYNREVERNNQAAKNVFYAVAAGRSPGVYTTWKECEAQVKGFSGNDYKRFNTQSEAEAYIDQYKREQEETLSANFEKLATTEEKETFTNQHPAAALKKEDGASEDPST